MEDSFLLDEVRIWVTTCAKNCCCCLALSVLNLPCSVFQPCSSHLGEHKVLPRIHSTYLIRMDKSHNSVKVLFKSSCWTVAMSGAFPIHLLGGSKAQVNFLDRQSKGSVNRADRADVKVLFFMLLLVFFFQMDVSVFLIGSILAEFQLNLQKKIVCRKLLCSQARNYSWRELFSYPYFRPTSLKIFKFLISEQLWNPIDFIITYKKIVWSFSSGTTGRGKKRELIFLTWNTTQMIVFQTGWLR